MAKKDFDAFINKQNVAEQATPIDWEDNKNQWILFINEFYDKLQTWLKPYQDEKKLSYSYKDLELTEDYIGSYTVKAMTLNFSNQKISITPIGTLLIGAKGRIDMEGARGRAQFVLVDKDSKGINVSVTVTANGVPPQERSIENKVIDWTWKIVMRDQRRISYDDFTEDNFFTALMEIVNA